MFRIGYYFSYHNIVSCLLAPYPRREAAATDFVAGRRFRSEPVSVRYRSSSGHCRRRVTFRPQPTEPEEKKNNPSDNRSSDSPKRAGDGEVIAFCFRYVQ